MADYVGFCLRVTINMCVVIAYSSLCLHLAVNVTVYLRMRVPICRSVIVFRDQYVRRDMLLSVHMRQWACLHVYAHAQLRVHLT